MSSQTADVVTADIPALQSFRVAARDADKDVEELRDETRCVLGVHGHITCVAGAGETGPDL